MTIQRDMADEFDNELDLDVLRGVPREKQPNCPICDEPMMFNDGAWFCSPCNGTDCGPEAGYDSAGQWRAVPLGSLMETSEQFLDRAMKMLQLPDPMSKLLP